MLDIILKPSTKRSILLISILVIIGCAIMGYVDGILAPSYPVKSAIKIFLFLLLPFYYCLVDKRLSFKKLFIPSRKSLLISIALGFGVYFFIVGGYFASREFFNYSNVTSSLQGGAGINKENFIFVALYISFINSLLEEFFFRGFAFLTLNKLTRKSFAYIFSASLFSIYHIAMMASWFDPLLFAILLVGLFMSGIFFNWLNEKNENIYASWLVHMCANFAINTVGFVLFGIL